MLLLLLLLSRFPLFYSTYSEIDLRFAIGSVVSDTAHESRWERTGKETEQGMEKEEEEEEEEEMRRKNISVACLNPSYPSNPSTRKR